MAIAFEESLKKSLDSGQILSVYLLFGEEAYLKKNYCDKITAKITDKDDIFAYSKFSFNCDLQDVYDAVMQIPITSDRKCVVLEDYDFEHCSKSDFDRLCDLVSEVPDTATLIIRFDAIEVESKKNNKLNKLVSAIEKNGGIAVKLDSRKPPELAKMLTAGALKRGCKMDLNTAKYLIETAGSDINLLQNELLKLCAFATKGTITKQTVDLVSVKTVEASVYNLSKNILDCNVEQSLSTLSELYFMRIEPMIILYAMSGIYIDMFRVYSAKASGCSLDSVKQNYSYKGREFLLDKAALNLRNFDFKKLSLSLKAIAKADNSLKSFGADDRIILEELIIRLIYINVKGDSVDKA